MWDIKTLLAVWMLATRVSEIASLASMLTESLPHDEFPFPIESFLLLQIHIKKSRSRNHADFHCRCSRDQRIVAKNMTNCVLQTLFQSAFLLSFQTVGIIFPTARKPFSLLGLVHEVAHQQVMIMAHVLTFLKWNSMCAPSAVIYAFGPVGC